MLWRKLRNALMVVRQLRYRLRYTRPQSDSETDGEGEEQPYQQEEDNFPLNQLVETGKRGPEDDAQYAGGFIFLVAPTSILSCLGQETAKISFSFRVKLPPAQCPPARCPPAQCPPVHHN